jgi:hypothetical protein
MISFDVTPKLVQYKSNTGARVTLDGLAPEEVVPVLIETPAGENFPWEVKANSQGSVTDYMELASGEGRYNFILGGCHQGKAVSVLACCCGPDADGRELGLTINSPRVSLGMQALATIGGLASQQPFVLHVTSTTGVYTLPFAAPSTGLVEVPVALQGAGQYQLVVTQGELVSNSVAFQVIGNVNELPTETIDSCAGAITVAANFGNNSVASGSNATLVLTVSNNSNEVQRVTCNVPLPSGLSSSQPIAIANEPIAPHSSRDFPFFVAVSNLGEAVQNLALEILPNYGSYQCNGTSYPIKGSTGFLQVLPAPRACGVEIVSFSFNISTVFNGQAAIALVRVRNIGQASLANVSLAPVVLPANLGGQTLQFAGVPLAPGEEYTYSKACVAATTTNSIATVTIPAGAITGNCGGAVVQTTRAVTYSVAVKP